MGNFLHFEIKISSLQEVSKKILQMVSEFKKVSKATHYQRQTTPTVPLCPLTSEPHCPDSPSLHPCSRLSSLSSLLLLLTEKETKNRETYQDKLEHPEILAAPFREKPVARKHFSLGRQLLQVLACATGVCYHMRKTTFFLQRNFP